MSENVRPKRDYHHGKTPAAWAGTILAMIGFLVGSAGFLISPYPNWMIVAVGAAVVALGVIVGWALVIAGYGDQHRRHG